MTIKECIDIVDNAKPNQYGIKEKVMWLSFVDETIINDVLKTHEGYDGRYDNFEGYTEDKLSVPLIVPSPYDRLYPQYIKMMIDSENGETARYNNSAALYNTYLNEYKKYYNKTHMPLDATQKIPSPVSININSALSDAQIEYIKRQLYYMLSQDVGEVISPDKLYDIVTNYVLNNLEIFKKYVGKDGKDGSKIIAYPLGFGTDVAVGHEEVLPDELYGKVKHLDIVIDTEGNCIFQYKAYEGDEEGSLPAESFRCIANPNPESGGLAEEKCIMEFKGVVDTLPETANEGEVYKVDGYMNETIGWAFESYDDTFKIYPDRIEFGTETEIYTEVFNAIYKANGAMVNLELFNYDTGEIHTIAVTKAENNILYGATSVASGYVVGSGTMEFRQVGFVKKTCVRFNGEWVEL